MNKTSRQKSQAALATVALAGLVSGSALRAEASASHSGVQFTSASAAGLLAADAAKGKHDCKGMNACKGQGGCKTGDNGCKGKNSCKGKGGCSTKDMTAV